MSAPERIWAASVTENYGEWQTTTDGLPRPTEYVRADLYAALEAQLAERVKVEDVLDAASEYMKTQYGIGVLSHPTDRRRILSALEPAAPEGQQEPVADIWDRPIEELCRAKAAAFYDTASEHPAFAVGDREQFIKENWCNWREDAVLEIAALTRPSEHAMTETVGPFITFANHAVEKTDDGWVWRTSSNERICDWFGPSDFGALKAAMEAGRHEH